MRRLLQWWSDLTSVLTDPQVLIGVTVAGGILAMIALAAYSVWRWRLEKAFIDLEIRDVLARVDHYATAIPDTDASAGADRRREYLQNVLQRWLRLQYQIWTDFQIYLALRATGGIQPATSRCAGELAVGFREMLVALWGNPDKTLLSAVVNNALATAFGMRPAAPHRAPVADTGQPAADPHVQMIARLYDPWAMEDALLAELPARGTQWLHGVLRRLEWQNAHARLAAGEASNTLVLEMVCWILHEEQAGPAPLPREVLDIYEVRPQLLPHLPDFLRDGAIETVQRQGTKQLTVRFRNVMMPHGTRFEGSVGLPAPLRADGRLWRSSRIEFDVVHGKGALVFVNR
ncbi:MAG TPA: hypothetical protein VFA04_07445 [Bryobacteraceae bacterium]|nr:hypothetical protein [Bryobacteraceae bacterium]